MKKVGDEGRSIGDDVHSSRKCCLLNKHIRVVKDSRVHRNDDDDVDDGKPFAIIYIRL